MPGPHPLALRERVVEAYENGEGTILELARRFKVGEASVNRWLSRKRKTGSVEPSAMGGARRPRIIQDEGEKFLEQVLQDVPDSTLAELTLAYQEEFGVSVSAETVRKALKNMGYTKKKANFRSPKVEREDVIEKQRKFVETMQDLKAEQIVFLDESGVNTAMNRKYGWSRRGERVRLLCPKRGKKLTIIGAIALDGVRARRELEGALNGETFKAFLREELGPKLRKGDVVIMDQLSVHKVAGVKEIIAKYGASVLYLPPYSPELNPIEMCWSFLKSHLRSVAPRALDRLRKTLKAAWSEVTQAHCTAWTRHCGYNVAKST